MHDRTDRQARGRMGAKGYLLVAVAVAAIVAVGFVLASGGLPTDDGNATVTPTDAPDPSGAQSTTETTGPTSTPGSPDETTSDSSATPSDGATPTDQPPESATTPERLSLANATNTVAGEGHDELGYSVAIGDVNGDNETDVLLGAPLYNATGTQSGAAFLYYGPVESGDLTIADADVTFHGESGGDWAGNAARLADVNADGTDDVVVGAPRNRAAGYEAGAVYVTYGEDLSGTYSLSDADVRLVGAMDRSFAGYSVDATDVVGGPGADLLIGAPRANASGGQSGAAYLVSADDLTSGSLDDADATFVGAGDGDRAGRAVAFAGDVDGDGRVDPMVGARLNDSDATNAGAAYVLLGDLEGRQSLADSAVTLAGTNEGDNAGFDVAGAGDVNDDGYADVLVGAPLEDAGGDGAGAVHVVHGGADLPERIGLADADVTLHGAAPGDEAGYSVAPAGDVTCDGRDDFLVGAPGTDAGGDDAGTAYLVDGAALEDGSGSLDEAVLALTGPNPGDRVGHADRMVAVSDEEGARIIVGAPFGDAPATTHIVDRECPDGTT